MMTEQDYELAQLQAENNELRKRFDVLSARCTAAEAKNQREHDLVRQMRCELFTKSAPPTQNQTQRARRAQG